MTGIKPSNLPGETPVSTIEDLAMALGRSDTGFFAQLLRLVAKADPDNRRRLMQVFPREVTGYETWMRFPTWNGPGGGRPPTVDELLGEVDR